MYPHAASPFLLFGFTALPLALVALVCVAHLIAARRLGVARPVARQHTAWLALAALGWQLIVTGAAVSGALSRFEARPPPLVFMLAGVVACAVWLVRSRVGHTLEQGLSLPALIAFQGFRLPLELLMHVAAEEGVMPPQMTYTGLNVDIVSGASALAVAGLLHAGVGGRWLAWAWNLTGSALLLAIIGIALASTPVFGAFGDGPALNTFVAYAPFTTLPTVMVLLALAGHALVWRKLLDGRPGQPTPSTAA